MLPVVVQEGEAHYPDFVRQQVVLVSLVQQQFSDLSKWFQIALLFLLSIFKQIFGRQVQSSKFSRSVFDPTSFPRPYQHATAYGAGMVSAHA
ncbi:unnamed protein product [Acanthoscelides obtectus]|uniref:Uncharacterized protein n=1 Tax=Acanthoscelides obtectus TaxID=200917 RepID=A0A9P0KR90_ACAOB|nr:unnamed protein product [Acanthoscelides obtectus]CAK1640162.1 hypothetical protein AOBTE_LOCUS11566 [Acanthoscelides obtectus]